jgi:hypothetical protein
LLAVALLAIGLASPAYARHRPAPPVLFGAGGWSWPDDHTLGRLHRHGLRTWRVTMNWAAVSPQPKTYNFSGYDQLMHLAARHHVEMMVTLTGCPAWACPSGRPTPPGSGGGLDAFQDFVAHAVARYGYRGTLWSRGHRRPVRFWQVLNEVNGEDQWPHPDPQAYAALLIRTAQTIRVTDPRAKVVLAGLGEKMTIWLRRYLPALYRVPGFKEAFDVAAPEGYAVRPRDVPRILRLTRRIMRRYRDTRKPLFVTEMSWSTGGPPFPFTTSEAGQAARLKASWKILRACRSRWRLRRVYWFSYADQAPSGGDYWGFHNGLVQTSGRVKPAWHTFLRFLRPARSARVTGRCTIKR